MTREYSNPIQCCDCGEVLPEYEFDWSDRNVCRRCHTERAIDQAEHEYNLYLDRLADREEGY